MYEIITKVEWSKSSHKMRFLQKLILLRQQSESYMIEVAPLSLFVQWKSSEEKSLMNKLSDINSFWNKCAQLIYNILLHSGK